MNLKQGKLDAEACSKQFVDELIYEHIKIMEENIRLNFENRQLKINIKVLYSKLESLRKEFLALTRDKAQAIVFRNYKLKN